jgi:26S proteasome regulatory subunit N12
LKILLVKLNVLVPTSDEPKELLLVREMLEIGALLAIRMQEIDAFERYIAQLKTLYADTKAQQSPRMYMILGLNLLRLLAQSKISEFHTELEAIGSKQLKNLYINHPVTIEQALMEGLVLV